MKTVIKGIGMVAGKPDANGNLITREALQGMVEKFTGCKVGYEFNPNIPHFGEVKNVSMDGDNLIVEAEIETEPFLEELAIVPAFYIEKSHMEGSITVIEKATFIEMALTSQPADKEATRMKL